MKNFLPICVTLLAITLAGCSSPGTKLKAEGPTMLDIYRGHMDSLKDADKTTRASLAESAERFGQPAFLHASAGEVDARFARLPNPDLVMYVTPHLSASRTPVPGYTTVFPLYETVEYAMPGEVRTRPATRTTTAAALRTEPNAPARVPASASVTPADPRTPARAASRTVADTR
jgi:conjugative transfer region lipoprotein (TIGR03751 family)